MARHDNIYTITFSGIEEFVKYGYGLGNGLEKIFVMIKKLLPNPLPFITG